MNTGGLGFSEVIEETLELQCPDCSDCGCSWLSHSFNLNVQKQPALKEEAVKISSE